MRTVWIFNGLPDIFPYKGISLGLGHFMPEPAEKPQRDPFPCTKTHWLTIFKFTDATVAIGMFYLFFSHMTVFH
jgi:hypothetical protein